MLELTTDPGMVAPTPRDLRRTNAHPDHWYPIAWSRELKPGRMLARRFAGEPVVIVRTGEGLPSRSRTAARTDRSRSVGVS